MRCDELRVLVSADLDREASAEEAAIVAAHLPGCPSCRKWRDDVQRLEVRFAEPVPVGNLPPLAAPGAVTVAAAAAATAAVPAQRRASAWAGRPVLAALLGATLAGGVYGVVTVGGDQRRPTVLPTVTTSASPTPSPSESPTPTPTGTPQPTSSPTRTSTSRSAVPIVTSVPSTPVAPQPLVASARAGVLDLVLRVSDARPVGKINAVLRIVNNTDRAVTYRSPSCRELVIRVDGRIAAPPQQPGCAEVPVQHTLEPGQAHQLVLDVAVAKGEHQVDGVFEGSDPEPTPDPTGAKPTPSPRQVTGATAGPVVVRVR